MITSNILNSSWDNVHIIEIQFDEVANTDFIDLRDIIYPVVMSLQALYAQNL